MNDKCKVRPGVPLRGEISVPGDKSISHRAVMFGSISRGTTEIRNFLNGEDCLSTIRCFRKMGIAIETEGDMVLVRGKGLHGLSAPEDILDCGNSGTTMRLISGILAGQSFSSVLSGDDSLCRRPMKRIMKPLAEMGAKISSFENSGCAPLSITGGPLQGITYRSPVASAQVKSCVLLAGLYAENDTSLIEYPLSRDHTERMLRAFGADLTVQEGFSDADGISVFRPDTEQNTIFPEADKTDRSPDVQNDCRISIRPDPDLTGIMIDVPGDISSAAYFLTAASVVEGSEIVLRNVGINPTRSGILQILQDMGADIAVENVRCGAEPAADLVVRAACLHGTEIGGEIIPALIDEIPVLAVAAAAAEGTTVIRDAAELKVKESDRIDLITRGLKAMGADVEATDDGMIIHGGKPLHGALIDTQNDHRIAMSFAVASLIAEGDVILSDASCTAISYPGFFGDLAGLQSL
ncbi:MAG: 3-phosphoshikimate 1-carboxyvinyltransferase [Eubacterium sp.]|nr:3-phosphoshikimate 1-carboxyvinyltransferase [Eubacterium sp.]